MSSTDLRSSKCKFCQLVRNGYKLFTNLVTNIDAQMKIDYKVNKKKLINNMCEHKVNSIVALVQSSCKL